jgi:hypothetical protein
MLRSFVVGALVVAGTFGLAGAASADVNSGAGAICGFTVVCAPVNVPVLTINRVLTDVVHIGSSS